MEKLTEREIAAYALIEITIEGAYNNIVLRKTLNKNDGLSAVQKAFITELVNGVLRNIIYIDYIINKFSKTKTAKMKPLILNILRISVYQIKFMDKVPTFAICNEAVLLTKKRGFAGLSGFVNGVLRNILRNIDNIEFPDEAGNPVEYLSVMYSYPKWLVEKFLKDFDKDLGLVKRMLASNNKPPKLTICVNTLKTDRSSLVKILEVEGVSVEPGSMLSNALSISKTANIKSLDSFKQGLYHVMDESAMLSVNILNPTAGQTLMDVCAAPGGKSFYASYIMENTGHIISGDIYEHKQALIIEGYERLGIKIIEAQLSDGSVFNERFEETADGLIIDAPCSGLGLIRKKPDIKLTKTESDIRNLTCIQREIFAASWKYVKPGGCVVYSTCTLTREENIDNFNWFTENFPFEPDDISAYLPENMVSETASKGYITILPHDYGTDGFFIARMRRKAK